MTSAHALTLVFTMTTISYVLFILNVKVKDPVDSRFYFALCISAALWSLSKGVALSGVSAPSASRWYLASIVAFMIFSSILLHHLWNKCSKTHQIYKMLGYMCAYLPLVIGSFMLVKEALFVSNYYQMTLGSWGWMRTRQGLVNDYISHGFYLFYSLMGLWILIKWHKGISSHKVKVQVKNIIISFCGVVAVSGFLRFLFYSMHMDIPYNLGPILLLGPVSLGIYYIEKNDHHNNVFRHRGTEVISSVMMKILYKYLAMGFLLGSVIAFFFEYVIGGKGLWQTLIFSSIIAVNGGLMRWILKSKMATYVKDTFISFTLSLFVPMLIFLTLIEGSGTSWPAPMIIMVAFMLYNNSNIIVGVTVSIIISYVVVGIIVPENIVEINQVDHFLRIFLTILMAIFACIVNRLYIATLRENKLQASHQSFINDVTSLLVKINYDDFETFLQQVFQMLGEYFQVEEVYFFSIDRDQCGMTYQYGWSKYKREVVNPKYGHLHFKDTPWLYKIIKNRGWVLENDTGTIVGQSPYEKEIVRVVGIQSMYGVTVHSESKMMGYLGMETLHEQAYLTDRDVYILKILSNVICDAISRNTSEKIIRDMAYHDPLTGLPNRLKFFSSLDSVMKISSRQKTGVLVGLIDLDDFKTINDTYGHDAGDALLQEVAKRLKMNVRDCDMVCRFGGDEFLVYFLGVQDQAAANVIGRETMEKFLAPFEIKGYSLTITFSLGLYLSLEVQETSSRAIGIADKAMYHAKRTGKNQFYIKTDSPEGQIMM